MGRNEGKVLSFLFFIRMGSQSYSVTSTRQGKNDHKGDSEINRAASSVTKGETCFQQARWPLPKAMKAGPPKNMGMGMPSRAAGAGPSPQWVQRAEHGNKEDYLEHRDLMEVAVLRFGLAWDLSPFFPSCFSFQLQGCLSYVCPIIVFWKHKSCLLSQVDSWRGLCLRMNGA